VKAPTLGKKVVKGFGWLRLVGRFARVVVDPHNYFGAVAESGDIGLFGMAMLTLATMDSLTQHGMSVALIQKGGDIKPYLGSAYSVQILRGILIGVLLYFSSPYIATFFHEPRVEPLLKVLSLAPVLTGLSNIGLVYFIRELNFRKLLSGKPEHH
jgi:PST family polysaccharide transporter